MKAKAKKTKAKRGVCRYCGCTQTQACYPPCCWVDRNKTVCSSDGCVQMAQKDGVKLIPGAALLSMA